MAKTWPAKDPTAVLDYVYRIPLDAGDSIAAKADVIFTELSGTVTIDSYDIAAAPDTVTLPDGTTSYGQDVTVWLSGGVDGETDVFKIAWTTVLTRQDDDIIMLAVVSKQIADLVLTGYMKPLPGHLIIRYPAFADVSTATIQYWLTDAERYVTTAWGEGDYAAGLMSLAAHNMAVAGLGTDNGTPAGIPAGVTSMRSGSLSVNLTPEAANAFVTGGYAATRYGQEYQLLAERNRGGPLIAPTGVPVDYAFAPFGFGPWVY